jgi:hypothetical protein
MLSHQVHAATHHAADIHVAEADRAREIALLERCPHALIFRFRYLTVEHQRLSAPADRGIEGFHLNPGFLVCIVNNLTRRNLAMAVAQGPERR